ncbi:MAG: ADP,ATP carrier protein 1 [Chlamydiae bacterium]|nr:ADP,ATP carrier protein 1 [Chlamydiota bacterium]
MSISQKGNYIKSFLWPVHKHEKRMLIPMMIMMFLACFNYSILRVLKDTIVITASGAKVLPYIKVWGVLPGAIILTYIFAKLSKRYSLEKIFFMITSTLLVFYTLFVWVLFPLQEVIHPHQLADTLSSYLPKGLEGFIALFRYWSFTLFYILAELWSTMVMGVLCWGFINQVTKLEQSKRFYGLLGISSNLAALVAGVSTNYLASFSSSWNSSLRIFSVVLLFSGFLLMLFFKYINLTISKDNPEILQTVKLPIGKKKKMKLKEGLRYLFESKYLLYIAVLVIAYNLSINVIEVVWKDITHRSYQDPAAFNHYMNNITTWIGLISLIASVCIPKWLSKLGWTKTALLTPLSMIVTGVCFFSFLLFHKVSNSLIFGFTPLAIAIFFGAAQYILSKAAKYSVFDATKEMAFIPLDPDLRLKGKAAIDGVGSRLGKSGSSLLFQSLLFGVGSISACVPFVSVVFLVVGVFWISSVRNLGKLFDQKSVDETQDSPLSAAS